MVYVLDTHALVWFLEGSDKLGAEALAVLRDADQRLVIPSIVLAEVKHLATRGRTRLSIDEVVEAIATDQRCTIYPLNLSVIQAMPLELDIHDGIICGTALVYQDILREEVKIASRDMAIQSWGIVETVW